MTSSKRPYPPNLCPIITITFSIYSICASWNDAPKWTHIGVRACVLSRTNCGRCTAQFVHDAEWLVHNAHTFYGGKHKITDDARTILNICRGEIDQTELCPDCYRVSIDRGDGWFTQICVRSLFHSLTNGVHISRHDRTCWCMQS